MTKEVLVSIAGLHTDMNETENEENEAIEVLSPGTYFFKDGKHYIFFEEMAEGIPGVTKTQIRIQGTESVEVIKKGAFGMNMLYEKNKKNRAYYATPYGEINLGIHTKEILVEESEENINVRVEYTMDVDYEPVADCRIRINVKPKHAKDFSICETMDF